MAPRPKDSDLDGPSRLGPTAGGYVQIAFQLPKFYLRILDSETEFLGRMRRSQLLELLVLRKAGLCRFERAATAKYRPAPGELEEFERYIWHCRNEIKAQLDVLRARLGNLPPRSWVVLALNEWIGLPGGVSDLDEPAAIDEDAPTVVEERSARQAPATRHPRVVRRPRK
jgi:hypothetical protein